MKKLKLREVMRLAQDGTAGMWQSWDSILGGCSVGKARGDGVLVQGSGDGEK